VREQVEALEAEYREVETRLANPTVIGDPVQLQAAGRRFKELEQVLAVGRPLNRAQDDLETARELAEEAEGDERELLRNEMADLEADIERLEGDLRALLLPRDPNDGRPVILEIRGAEGGEEANLFARDLHEMYLALAAAHGWSIEPMEARESDMGGFSEVMVLVRGDDAWTRLKY